MNVAAILKSKGHGVVTAPPDTPLEEIARRLSDARIGAIVVVGHGGDIAGIISERDLVKAIAQRGSGCLTEPVSRSMTRGVKTCDADDTLDEVFAMMTSGRFRHLPVLENGRLAGMVSIGDAVKHHIAEVEMEASVLRDYIVQG